MSPCLSFSLGSPLDLSIFNQNSFLSLIETLLLLCTSSQGSTSRLCWSPDQKLVTSLHTDTFFEYTLHATSSRIAFLNQRWSHAFGKIYRCPQMFLLFVEARGGACVHSSSHMPPPHTRELSSPECQQCEDDSLTSYFCVNWKLRVVWSYGHFIFSLTILDINLWPLAPVCQGLWGTEPCLSCLQNKDMKTSFVRNTCFKLFFF